MAAINYKHFTLGVEEEYMVIDPVSRELKSHEQKIVHEGQKVIKDKVKAEMHQAVVEVGTDICQNIDEALMDVATLRKTISGIAEDLGLWVGASGTHPFSHWESQLITDHARYSQIVNELQEAARSNLIFGLHVHVEDIGPVRDEPGDPVARRAVGDVGHAHLFRHRRRDREEVVLDDEHHRQPVDRREIDRLVEVARARRAVPPVREDDPVLLADLDRERDTGRLGELRRDADRAGHDVRGHVAELVHDLSPAGVRIRRLREHPEELVRHGLPEDDRDADVAVVRMDPVMAAPDHPGRPDLGRLVAVGHADERGAAHAVHLHHPLAEHPAQEHGPVHALRVIEREAEDLVTGLLRRYRHQCHATSGAS